MSGLMTPFSFWVIPGYLVALFALNPLATDAEWFVLEAVHDIVNHGWDLAAYSQFKPDLPQTFVGPLVVTPVAAVVRLVLWLVLPPSATQLHWLIATNVALSLIICAALHRLHLSVLRLNRCAGWVFPVLFFMHPACVHQWAYAMNSNLAFSCAAISFAWLLDDSKQGLVLLGFTAAVFSPVLWLAAAVIIVAMLVLSCVTPVVSWRLGLYQFVWRVVLGSVIGGAVLVCVDLAGLGRLAWPAFEFAVATIRDELPKWSLASLSLVPAWILQTVLSLSPRAKLFVGFSVYEFVSSWPKASCSFGKTIIDLSLGFWCFVEGAGLLARLLLSDTPYRCLWVLWWATVSSFAMSQMLLKEYTTGIVRLLAIGMVVLSYVLPAISMMIVALKVRPSLPGCEALEFLGDHIHNQAARGLMPDGNYESSLMVANVYVGGSTVPSGVLLFCRLHGPVHTPHGSLEVRYIAIVNGRPKQQVASVLDQMPDYSYFVSSRITERARRIQESRLPVWSPGRWREMGRFGWISAILDKMPATLDFAERGITPLQLMRNPAAMITAMLAHINRATGNGSGYFVCEWMMLEHDGDTPERRQQRVEAWRLKSSGMLQKQEQARMRMVASFEEYLPGYMFMPIGDAMTEEEYVSHELDTYNPMKYYSFWAHFDDNYGSLFGENPKEEFKKLFIPSLEAALRKHYREEKLRTLREDE